MCARAAHAWFVCVRACVMICYFVLCARDYKCVCLCVRVQHLRDMELKDGKERVMDRKTIAK